MGSPVSKAIRTAPHPPLVWLRYVDDTFVKIHEYFVNEFTEHFNSINENIKFTTEPEMEGKLPFMDSCTTLNDDGSFDLTVYRKPTHTDQYLNFDSNHYLQHKRSVVRTLINRANCMVTKLEQKDAEVRHVKSALKANGYKEWAFKIPPPKTSTTPLITPQGARPAPVWAYHISEVHHKNWPEFSKTTESGLTTSPSRPCAPSWSTPKTRHLISKSVVSYMKSSVRNALRSMSVKLPVPWRQGWKTT